MKIFFIKFITLYQKVTGFFKKPSCRFYPTCSEYTKEAIKKHGSSKGIWLGILRILKCHPWQESRIDLVK